MIEKIIEKVDELVKIIKDDTGHYTICQNKRHNTRITINTEKKEIVIKYDLEV